MFATKINGKRLVSSICKSVQINVNKANNTKYAKPIVDLVVKKSSDKYAYHVDETIHWTINVLNKGPCVAYEVVGYDTIPEGCEFIGYTSTKGAYDPITGIWDIGVLAKGETATLDLYCKALVLGLITKTLSV